MENHKTNILGTEYDIRHDLKDNETDGITCLYAKEIKIRPLEDMLNEEECTEKEKILRREQVIRHELLHAYFFEAGMSKWAYDEKLVDFLAIQFPKMVKSFTEVGCL